MQYTLCTHTTNQPTKRADKACTDAQALSACACTLLASLMTKLNWTDVMKKMGAHRHPLRKKTEQCVCVCSTSFHCSFQSAGVVGKKAEKTEKVSRQSQSPPPPPSLPLQCHVICRPLIYSADIVATITIIFFFFFFFSFPSTFTTATTNRQQQAVSLTIEHQLQKKWLRWWCWQQRRFHLQANFAKAEKPKTILAA